MPAFELETIIEEIPAFDLTKSGVVTGWRRESGETTMPKLFLRPHLLEKKDELDKFMSSEIPPSGGFPNRN